MRLSWPRNRRARIAAPVALVLLLVLAAAAAGQDDPADPPAAGGPDAAPSDPPTSTPLTVELLEQRLAALDQPGDLDQSTVAEARQLYEQAIAHLQEARAQRRRAAELRDLAASAPERLAAAREQLDEPLAEPTIPAMPEASVDELKQAMRAARATLEEAEARAAALTTEVQQRASRRTEAPKLLAAARQELETLQAADATDAPALPAALTRARQAEREARQAALESRIDAINAEQASYVARAELLTIQRDLAARRVAEAQGVVDLWSARVAAAEAREIAQQAERTDEQLEEAAQIHPALAEVAEVNQRIVAERESLSERLSALQEASGRVAEQKEALKTKLADVRSRAEATRRPSQAFGLMLRKMREELPEVRQLRAEIADRRDEIERVQLRLIELDRQRSALVNIADRVDRRMAELEPTPEGEADARVVRDALSELLRARRQLLTDLYTDYEGYFNRLIEVNSDVEETAETVRTFSGFIDERILWVRSTDPVDASILRRTGEAGRWLIAPSHWSQLVGATGQNVRARPLSAIVAVLGILLAWLLWHRSRRGLHRIAETVSGEHDRFTLTLGALLPTIGRALPLPLTFWIVGWCLVAVGEAATLAEPLGGGLQAAAVVLFTFELLRQIVQPDGLGPVHFRWREERLRPIRRHLPWLSAVLVGSTGLIVATQLSPDDGHANALGRLVYVAGKIALAAALAVVLHPERGMFAGRLRDNAEGWANRLRGVWYPLVVAVPLAFAGLALAGYFYTAMQLDRRLFITAWLVLGLALVNAIVHRWLFVERRRILLDQRRRRRAEAEAERARAAEEQAEGDRSIASESLADVEIEEPELDVYTVNVQTRKLLGVAMLVAVGVGLWAIWAAVLPALGYLDRVTLWTDAEATVSLTNVLGAIVIAVLTFIAARNVPGLLEMFALQRLPLEPGVRFAITTIFSYCVVITGIILAFAAIEVGWSKVQWLAAAVTVGLGFGLQEIFANFVSGLIILFEQPIRVGDIVTVGDVTGVVSRIRIRATTITDWDRKEYIVPNKEFVTGRMLNWSLSDQTNRVTIAVGVAYGSDTDEAARLLAKVARDNPLVLDDPAPIITFEGFGDSTLDMKLRAYLPNMDNRLRAVHELHTAVDQAFREAGIEIAFPQRDLHIRSSNVPLASNPPAPDTPGAT